MNNRGVRLQVVFSRAEAKHIREIVKANKGNVSEFIRTCVNTQLAQVGDPEAMELLTAMFEKGMKEVVERRVKAEMDKVKKRA